MDQVTIVEVGPRDGFQSVASFIPTEVKLEITRRLMAAGLERIEVGSFVSKTALPQMSDIAALLAGLDRSAAELSVLVPNFKGAQLATEAGIGNLVLVVSASESHNRRNVRSTIGESLEESRRIVEEIRPAGRLRINIATAFHCPFEGRTPLSRVLNMVQTMLSWAPEAEIALCDTTGKATPFEVARAFDECALRFGSRAWAYHAHDTYGLGAATSWTAYEHGVRVLDASIAGLGGCPFAPGASGNVATEDLAHMFETSGVATGIDLTRLLDAARLAAGIEGAVLGGRVRIAAERSAARDREEERVN